MKKLCYNNRRREGAHITKLECAERLKSARESVGLTQNQVAKKIGRPQQTVGSWETGRSQPDANTLRELLILYNCSPNEFFNYHDPKERLPRLSEQEIKIALAYRVANADDRTVVNITLRKYMKEDDGEKSEIAIG